MEGEAAAAPAKSAPTEPSTKEEGPRATAASMEGEAPAAPAKSASSASSYPPQAQERPSHKLYIGNLHPNVTEAHLIKLFQPYGRIDRLEFVWHRTGPKRGQPRGFAFVEYRTVEEATRAVRTLHNVDVKGRNIMVRYMKDQDSMPFDPRSVLMRAKARSLHHNNRDRERDGGSSSSDPRNDRRGTVVVLGGSLSKTRDQGPARGSYSHSQQSGPPTEEGEANALERRIRQLKRKLENMEAEEAEEARTKR